MDKYDYLGLELVFLVDLQHYGTKLIKRELPMKKETYIKIY